jgi:hypothetical protein
VPAVDVGGDDRPPGAPLSFSLRDPQPLFALRSLILVPCPARSR